MTGDIVDIIPLYPHLPSHSCYTIYRIAPTPSQFWEEYEVLKANKLWSSLEPEDLPKHAIHSYFVSPAEYLVQLAAQVWLNK